MRAEFAVLEENVNNRLGEDNQHDCRRQRKQNAVFDGFVLCAAGFFIVAGFELAGKNRQQSDADGGADHAERQLLHTVCIIKPGYGAGADQRNQNRVDKHVNLIDAGAEHSGSDTAKQRFDFGVANQPADVEMGTDKHAFAPQKPA